jgi:hypothetical protein
VVATITVTGLGAALPGASEVGETVQVASEGAPVQLNPTVWLKPPKLPRLRENVADNPGETEFDVGAPEGGARLKSGPLPARLMLWGLFGALSLTVSCPVLVPSAVGVKVTLIMQLDPTTNPVPQLLVWLKSPLTAILETVSGRFPELVSVTPFAVLVVPVP